MGDAQVFSSPVKEVEGEPKRGKAYQGTVSSHNQHLSGHVHNSADNASHFTQYHPHGLNQGLVPNGHFDARQAQSPAVQSPFNMASMTNALPSQAYNQSFTMNMHQHQQHQHHNHSPVQHSPGGPGMPTMYNNSGPHLSHYAAQPNMLGQQFYMQPQGSVPHFYGHLGSVMMNQHTHPSYYYQPPIHPYPNAIHTPVESSDGSHHGRLRTSEHQALFTGAPAQRRGDASASVVRGPPRKPRQSGHAIWIGNLPPQTDLMSLVRHVCTETQGLESLFLISKSNCAFANFRDEERCVAAQQKLHDSKFQSVRLVSRLRKSTVEGSAGQTAPTGPASISPAVQSPINGRKHDMGKSAIIQSQDPEDDQRSDLRQGADPDQPRTAPGSAPQIDRFFVLKSLTVEDLELSVQNGVWATQSHNEEALNTAFESAANVYLVFSANKSGEYFGYARMTSPINTDPAAAIEFAPKVQTTNEIDLPKSITTEATNACPKGRIIDDSSRGTIFWELDRDDEEDAVSDARSDISGSMNEPSEGEGSSKTWGKPFNLEWLSITRLPFYRTRGLRNVWNSNRDIKIARDGTELETSVGKKLIGLFNRPHVAGPPMNNMAFRSGAMPPSGYAPQPTPTMAPLFR